MTPKRSDAFTTEHRHCAADEQHHDLGGQDDNAGDERNYQEGDGGLCEHSHGVGNRQRLPEEDASVTPLAMQSLEAVKHCDEEGGGHEKQGNNSVGRRKDIHLSSSRVVGRYSNMDMRIGVVAGEER